ncbi:hypothetical protein SBA2_840009 [Acidobacteriia bacterium SbA2]|nr:hypothetical protein SBA2_840009 [Acidobacteriia bacterium SbA2]
MIGNADTEPRVGAVPTCLSIGPSSSFYFQLVRIRDGEADHRIRDGLRVVEEGLRVARVIPDQG